MSDKADIGSSVGDGTGVGVDVAVGSAVGVKVGEGASVGVEVGVWVGDLARVGVQTGVTVKVGIASTSVCGVVAGDLPHPVSVAMVNRARVSVAPILILTCLCILAALMD